MNAAQIEPRSKKTRVVLGVEPSPSLPLAS